MTTTTSTRWVGSGSSREPDAATAGREACLDAVADRPAPVLLVVFASDAYDLTQLSAAIRAAAPGVPLIGCSTSGEIAASGAGDSGVVVMALGGAGFRVSTSRASVTEVGLREAGGAVAAAATDVAASPHRVLLVLSDGLAGDQEEIVRGAYAVVGAEVPLVGGCAGDDLRMQSTSQLYDGDVLKGSVVAAAIGSDAPFGIGVEHGWRRVGEPMVVTASDGVRVLTLDDEPALDAYLRRLDAPAEAHVDPAAFTRFALTHPLGLSRRSTEEVRMVAEADFEERSLTCIARVPQGGLAWIMEGDGDSVLAATDAACRSALAGLDEQPPLGLFAFDCIARRGVLGDEGIRQEVERIAEHAAMAPVGGFYTYGEIARNSAVGGFHNQTLVVLAIA
ncbi:MAG: FIST C-terminal domain-containing protein [Frankiaceae bacterium]|nr:FIST C-terminal domain-containing protein [Frankiaceae bacterium]